MLGCHLSDHCVRAVPNLVGRRLHRHIPSRQQAHTHRARPDVGRIKRGRTTPADQPVILAHRSWLRIAPQPAKAFSGLVVTLRQGPAWRSPSLTRETQQFRSRCRVRHSVSEKAAPGCPGTFCSGADRSLSVWQGDLSHEGWSGGLRGRFSCFGGLERFRMLVTTPGRSKGASVIARSRARRSIRPWRRTGSRISGESEDA